MKNHYFHFSKKERYVLALGFFLNFLLALLPHFANPVLPSDTKDWLNMLPMDSINSLVQHNRMERLPLAEKPKEVPKKIDRFYFDPNSLEMEGWIKLGITEKAAAGIKKFLDKGGRFKKPEDLYKMYSLKNGLADSLVSWVRIKEEQAKTASNFFLQDHKGLKKDYENSRDAMIFINQADSAAWVALPGIGPAFARRILNFREKLGGFSSVAQVAETYGLADSLFQKIKPRLTLGLSLLRKISLNNSSREALQQHPYIRWKGAEAIVTYREAHGNLKSTRELLLMPYFTEDLYGKLEPYLSLE